MLKSNDPCPVCKAPLVGEMYTAEHDFICLNCNAKFLTDGKKLNPLSKMERLEKILEDELMKEIYPPKK